MTMTEEHVDKILEDLPDNLETKELVRLMVSIASAFSQEPEEILTIMHTATINATQFVIYTRLMEKEATVH